MRYIPSEEVKGNDVPYEGIAERVPWIVEDGTLAQLTEKYSLRERKDILDIGCGNGQTLSYFASSAHTLAGIDLNNYLNVPEKDRIDFAVVDLNFERLPYADASKDLVFALQVMEHLENPFLFMREAHRVLRSGGLFILSAPNPYSFSAKLRYLFTDNMRRWNSKNDHLLFLTKDVFNKTYGARFAVVGTFFQKGLTPFIGRLYRMLGVKATAANTKILPRTKLFGDSLGYVLRKKDI
jgi:SAM-dependent methyltransferase